MCYVVCVLFGFVDVRGSVGVRGVEVLEVLEVCNAHCVIIVDDYRDRRLLPIVAIWRSRDIAVHNWIGT